MERDHQVSQGRAVTRTAWQNHVCRCFRFWVSELFNSIC